MFAAETIVQRIAKAVGCEPSAALRGEKYVVAAWPFAPRGEIAAGKFAWVGTLSSPPDEVRLDCASNLHGDYALVAGTAEGLLVARGRHAGRCLYTTRLQGDVVVACSRLAPLVACADRLVPNVANLAALAVIDDQAEPSATAFEGIRRVEASQGLLLGGVKARASRSPLQVPARSGSADDLAEQLDCALRRAIRRALAGARRTAVFVSGGLDSSAVLAHAIAASRRAGGPPIDAVSISFAGPGDDRPYLDSLCEALRIEPIRIRPREASESVVRALILDAAPCIWPTAGWNVMSRILVRERGADRALTGMGGDQMFNGDPRSLVRGLFSSRFHQTVRRVVRYQRAQAAGPWLGTAELMFAPWLAPALPAVRRRRRRRRALARWPWAGPELRRYLREAYEHQLPDRAWAAPTNEARLQRMVAHDFMLISENRGQIEAATGIERIDPLLDDEIVELVASFPQESLLAGERSRGLFRHALRGVVPDRVRLRGDKARLEPGMAELVGGADHRALRDLATMGFSADLGLVDPRRYRRHFDDVLAAGARSADWIAVWPMLSVEAFLRAHWGTPSEAG